VVEVDDIVIGAGQAGPSLAARLAEAGRRVVLVEREHLGGTCVNDGCIPTKTLIASARAAHVARRAADWGVRAGEVSVDMRAVKARKDAVVKESVDSLGEWLRGLKTLRLVWGQARFVAPDTVDAGGERFKAQRIFLNTGGRAVVPDWPGVDTVKVLTNTSMMDLDVLPDHLLVVGGSYIGLEFAQMVRRFGARVTVLEHGERLIAREDPEVSKAVQEIVEGEGVEVRCGVRDISLAPGPNGEGVVLSCTCAGDKRVLGGSHLLVAVGRRPNTDGLGLEHAGVKLDARGFIEVDDQLRTSVPGIWALGDVNGRGAFTHTSYNDHEIVAANLLDDDPRRVSDRIPCYALFTDPPLGRVGMTESEVRATGKPALVATMPMTRVGRARERGETQGFMKVLVDAQSKKILGASLLGIEADEVVHVLLDVMAAGAPYTVIRRAMHIHPTVSELVPTLLGMLKPLP